MRIEFSKVVVCFYFCATVVCAYYVQQDYYKSNDRRISKKYVPPTAKYSYYDSSRVRQSRYPKFTKVMTRIENMNADDDSLDSKQYYYKIRHKGWSNYRPTTTTTTTTEKGLFDTYGELENEDDFDDYEDSLEDVDDEVDYDDDSSDTDDHFLDSIEDDVQAEEPTERPTVAPKPVSTLTEYKWRHFGTISRVEESRRQHLNLRPTNEQRRVNAVLEHFVRVNQQGKCRKPLPRVIPVQKEHPDPSKTYTPHCTVLHRCAEDTGCCKHDTKCQYKSRVLVQLYFYTKTLGSTETKVEKLSFYNHTECECKEKSNYTSADNVTDPTELSFKSANTFHNSLPNRCKCPGQFEPTHYDYKCSCDCEEGNQDCVQLKKGKEHFGMTDRICIQNDECGTPVCEYGAYLMQEGKCPSKKEKMEEFRKIRINY